MYIPVISRIKHAEGVLIERVLPVSGMIHVSEKDQVVPYDHVGSCVYSHRKLLLPTNFKPKKMKKSGKFYYTNDELGTVSSKKVIAPFNGNLNKLESAEFAFVESEGKYILLAGVWGEIAKVFDKESVLIKTKTKDLNFVASTRNSFSGELIVFPNPSHLLEKFYLDEFSSGAADGKIVYVGSHVSVGLLKDALRYSLGGVIAGSADFEAFRFAKENNMSFGLFSGFGDIATPDDIYEVLNNVSNRFVFFQGERNLLRIPMSPDATQPEALTRKRVVAQPLKLVKKGLKVLVMQKPYFGGTGTVDRINESSIFVKFSDKENSVEVKIPNIFALD